MTAILVASFCNLGGPDEPPLGVFPEPGGETMLVPTTPLPGIVGITGLAADQRYLYAVGQIRTDPAATPVSELLTFDRTGLRLRDRYTFRLGLDVHSLTIVDGELMAVSTGTDALVELALRDGRVSTEHVHWRADPIGPVADLLHLNAVGHHRGTLLVSGFGRRTGPSWNSARAGFVRQVGVRDGAPGPFVATDLRHPHSLLADGDDILLCASHDRAIRTLRSDWLTGLPGYARGLCRADSMIYVGTSVGRRRSRSRSGGDMTLGNPQDMGLPTGECAVTGVLRSTGRPVYRTVLTPLVREVYDLLFLHPPATPDPACWRVRRLESVSFPKSGRR